MDYGHLVLATRESIEVRENIAIPRTADLEAIRDPKQYSRIEAGYRNTLYPYYAGYSPTFVDNVLDVLDLPAQGTIFDPWLGSGTTTSVAAARGLQAVGWDLNPAMVVIAKARLTHPDSLPSFMRAAAQAIDNVPKWITPQSSDDPLRAWFDGDTAVLLRRFMDYCQRLRKGRSAAEETLVALLQVALFRVARSLLNDFGTTNPTWIKRPAGIHLVGVPEATLVEQFANEVSAVATTIEEGVREIPAAKHVVRQRSSYSRWEGRPFADAAITSPPYCTRIDYAVATCVELALLNLGPDSGFDALRRQLMGTATVEPVNQRHRKAWSPTCDRFLNSLWSHHSKASQTYYYKNHVQYFRCLYNSMRTLSSCLKPSAHCVIVAQDSYYKDLHNDLPAIIQEMGETHRLSTVNVKPFRHKRTMRLLNGRARAYASATTSHHIVTESVIILRKDP